LAAAGLRTFGHRLRPVSYLVNLYIFFFFAQNGGLNGGAANLAERGLR